MSAPFVYAGTFYPIRPGPVIIEFEQRSRVAAALSVIFFPVFGTTAPATRCPAAVT